MKKEMTPPKDNIAELQRTHELIYEQAAILSRSEDIPTAIQGMLAAIGSFVNAERAYIFEDKGTHYSNTFEWCAPGIRPEKDNLREIDLDTISAWTDILIHGECIIISELESIKEEYPRVYDILKPQSISNVVEAPIMVDNHLIGFLGVDNSPVKTSQRVAETLQVLGTFIAITLKNQEGRLESLEQANTALSETNAALRVAYESANQANAAKTTFLSKMSHDIRTPMNAIVGFTSLAIAHIERREQVEEYLKKIMSSGNHLLNLINDVLDMSHIESGKMNLEEKPCSLPEILHELCNILQGDIRKKKLRLQADAVDILNETVYCDKLRLNQVLLNLFSNSIKYTNEGGSITLRVVEKSGAPSGYANYEFSIRDTGIGMSEEFASRIFEPFERENNSTISGIQGTGLGMSITKSIVDAMKGDIKVKSKQGQGTEFIVSFTFRIRDGLDKNQEVLQRNGLKVLIINDSPEGAGNISCMLERLGIESERTESKENVLRHIAGEKGQDSYYDACIIDWFEPDMDVPGIIRRVRKELGKPVPVIVTSAYDWAEVEDEAKEGGVTVFCSKPLFISELGECLRFIATGEKISGSNNGEVREKPHTGRILLAEDVELNQEIAVAILEDAGFTAEVAENGQVAVDMVSRSEPGYYQLVLMDIQMPVMNGYEATKAIRRLENEKLASIPIFAMSANAFEEDRRESLKCGMNGHIAKPIDIDRLLDTLSRELC